MSISIKNASDVAHLRKAGQVVGDTLAHLKQEIKAGVSLSHLDQIADEFVRSLGAIPSFKGLYGFPHSLCTSLNEVIIHGLADDTIVKEGDILGIDIGVKIDGWYGDGAITVAVGDIDKRHQALIDCSKEALYHAIDAIKTGMRFKELSKITENFILSKGFVPLRGFCGHGIGQSPHEEPEIPNYIDTPNLKQGPKIKEGMVFCLEPMICMKSGEHTISKDQWSVVSVDGCYGSHYEHMIAIVNGKAEILTQNGEI